MEDQYFRIFCNMLDGLAFLPIADLPEGIAYIRSVITEEPAETEELVDYIETTYVTGTYRPVQRNGEQRLTMRRVPPMFPPSIWSVHSATVDSDPRTNNVGEGWNNKFFTLVGMVSTRTCHSYNSYTAKHHWHTTNKENQPEASAVTETTTEPV